MVLVRSQIATNRSQEPRRAAHTAAGGGNGPNDSGPADAHRDPDLDPGELDELMYELYCSSGGSSGSGLDDVSCSQLPHYCGPLELREVPGAGVGVYVREDVAAGTLLLLATHPLALLRSGPGGGQVGDVMVVRAAADLSAGQQAAGVCGQWATCGCIQTLPMYPLYPPPAPHRYTFMRPALAARRWRVEELPPPYLQTYVDLLAQASDVAGAVAPGSDLTTALALPSQPPQLQTSVPTSALLLLPPADMQHVVLSTAV
eukprot:XP_001699363.1 predicted protein [Chlamydomonas reinhardtii]